jgi:sRNA-binding protein
VKWYESHFSYHYALQTGAKRLGVNGEEAGVVTATEQRSAEKYIAECKQKMVEKNLGSPVAVAIGLRRAQRITDDALRKIDAPPQSKMTAKSEEGSDHLAELQRPIDAVRRALRENPEPLRTAFAIAGLQVVIDVAGKIIGDLKKNEGRVMTNK